METTNIIPFKKDYEGLVEQGIKVVNKQENMNWELGELALDVGSTYGEGKLEQFAEDIGINYSTLQACIATVRAWPQKLTRVSFWKTHQTLNNHPDRYKIMADNPKISSRQAIAEMKKYRASLTPLPSKTWTPEKEEKMEELLKEGLTYKEAGVELGASAGAVSGRLARIVEERHNLEMQQKMPPMPENTLLKALEYINQIKSPLFELDTISLYANQMHDDARHRIAEELKEVVYDRTRSIIKRLVDDMNRINAPACGVPVRLYKDTE